MATNLGERDRNYFLLKDANTPGKLGPGAYFEDAEPSPFNKNLRN
jgi:hypothetical protein